MKQYNTTKTFLLFVLLTLQLFSFTSAQFVQSCSQFSWPIFCCGDGFCFNPIETVQNCPSDCQNYIPEPQAAVFAVIPNVCGPNCCSGTSSGVVFANDYFELIINGKFVKADPVSFTPDQAVQLTYSVDTSKPVEYAVYLQNYQEDSTGLQYNHTKLGSGGFIAKFSDGTTTNSKWKCIVVNSGPNPNQCCYHYDGTLNCVGNQTCATTNTNYASNWYTTDYDFSSWPNAKVYSVSSIGFGTPSLYSNATATCLNSIPGWPDYSLEYTTGEECADGLQNYNAGNFSGASMIWGPDLIQNNDLLCRYTQPATTQTYSSQMTQNCPVCNAQYRTVRSRVRKELRELTSDEWNRVINAYRIMKNTTQADGEALYGSYYRNFDYFPSKHAVTTTDTRGDQGHFSAAFISWHSVFLLEFENSLLAVDPSIPGLPYWDSTKTSPSVYSSTYFGSVPGTDNGIVIDGPWANWPIQQNWTIKPYYKYINNNSTIGFTNSQYGLLRNSDNNNSIPKLTRFGTQYTYLSENFDRCRYLQAYWNDWFECIELGSVRGSKVVEGAVISHHSGPHLQVGATQNFTSGGDFMDVVTSPNEPMFMFHHANMDRSKMWYMLSNQNKENIFWGFPVKNSAGIPSGEIYDGINLNDPMSSAWGFTAASVGLGSDNKKLLTHADSLCMLGPMTAPYIYSDMISSLSPNSIDTTFSPTSFVEPVSGSSVTQTFANVFKITGSNNELVIEPTVPQTLKIISKMTKFVEYPTKNFNTVPTNQSPARSVSNFYYVFQPPVNPTYPSLCVAADSSNCFVIQLEGTIQNGATNTGTFYSLINGGFNPSNTSNLQFTAPGGNVINLGPLGLKFDTDLTWNAPPSTSNSMFSILVELDWQYSGTVANPLVTVTPITAPGNSNRNIGFSVKIDSSTFTISFPGQITFTSDNGTVSYLDGNILENPSQRTQNGKSGTIFVYVLTQFVQSGVIRIDPIVELSDVAIYTTGHTSFSSRTSRFSSRSSSSDTSSISFSLTLFTLSFLFFLFCNASVLP